MVLSVDTVPAATQCKQEKRTRNNYPAIIIYLQDTNVRCRIVQVERGITLGKVLRIL